MSTTTDRVWRGIAITEGFDDPSVLATMHIVATKTEQLEGEEGMGTFHFHKVEVDGADVDSVLERVSLAIKPSWFLHVISGDGSLMKVVFRGKCFSIQKGDDEALHAVIAYGKQNGVHEDQLHLHRLFDNPYDE